MNNNQTETNTNRSSSGKENDNKSKGYASSTSNTTAGTFAKKEESKTMEKDLAQDDKNIDQNAIELDNLRDMNRRLQISLAASQNNAKLLEKQTGEQVKYAISKFVKDLSNVFHALSMATKSIDKKMRSEDQRFEGFIKGIDMTMDSFLNVLSKHSIEVINPIDERFDSNLHEAMSMVKHSKPKDQIVDVLQVGFKLHDRLIVPAKVIVSAG